MRDRKPPEPWHAFLTGLDNTLSESVELHCIGGFVITQMYGFERSTVDVDALLITPRDQQMRILERAGKGSELHKKYRLYLDFVTIVDPPYNYDERLQEMFPRVYSHLTLFALDPYDLALTKLSRNIERDREDVKYLARKVPFDLAILKQRYEQGLRSHITGDPRRHDLTVELWVEMIMEDRARGM
jgi:hypothetical protein